MRYNEVYRGFLREIKPKIVAAIADVNVMSGYDECVEQKGEL